MTISPNFDIQSDPDFDFAIEIVNKLQQAGHTAYWAGGCVRDLLLGKHPKDYDVATSAHPKEVRKLFGYNKTLAVGASFGVVLVRTNSSELTDVEVATFRTDLDYIDGRRPSEVVFSTPEEDAERRDLTINGLFYDPIQKVIHDFVDGQKDLEQKTIRAIGNPADRFEEDKLRLLRTVRFAAHLNFKIEPTTWNAIKKNASQINVVSAERIAQELRRMLTDKNRTEAVRLLLKSELLDVYCQSGTVTDFKSPIWLTTLKTFELLETPSFPLAFSVLQRPLLYDENVSPEILKKRYEKSGRNLRLSNQEIAHSKWLSLHHQTVTNPHERSLAEIKKILVSPFAGDFLKWEKAAALATNQPVTDVEFLQDYYDNTPPEEINPPRLIGGHDLIKAKIKSGPTFTRILDQIRDAQLNNEISNRAEGLEMLARLKQELQNDMNKSQD